jgi:hypothetical protein
MSEIMSVLSTRKVYVKEDAARRWQLIVEWYDFQRNTPVHVAEETSVDVGGSHYIWELDRTYNHLSCWYDVLSVFPLRCKGVLSSRRNGLNLEWTYSQMERPLTPALRAFVINCKP